MWATNDLVFRKGYSTQVTLLFGELESSCVAEFHLLIFSCFSWFLISRLVICYVSRVDWHDWLFRRFFFSLLKSETKETSSEPNLLNSSILISPLEVSCGTAPQSFSVAASLDTSFISLRNSQVSHFICGHIVNTFLFSQSCKNFIKSIRG